MLNLVEFLVMRVRFTNPFLFSVGSALGIGSIFITNSVIAAFGCGICFGLILLNYLEEKK